MASTYSSDLKLELMATGENAGTWGTKTNTNLNLVQQAIAGYQAIDVASSDVALTMADASISNARNMILNFTGTLTGTVSVSSGAAAVTGVGTAFTTELNAGDVINIASEEISISTITNDTTLTLA